MHHVVSYTKVWTSNHTTLLTAAQELEHTIRMIVVPMHPQVEGLRISGTVGQEHHRYIGDPARCRGASNITDVFRTATYRIHSYIVPCHLCRTWTRYISKTHCGVLWVWLCSVLWGWWHNW